MKGVTFDVSIPRYLLARSLGKLTTSVHFGRLSRVRLEDVEEPSIPGPQWAKLRVLSCGICGTDISNVTYSASPALEPFGSFPAVIGHEILAQVEEVGPGVDRVEVGQRVVVDPFLSCQVRGYTPDQFCPSCRQGLHCTCEMAGEDGPVTVGGNPLGPGTTIGYHRDLPGGWGEKVVAHQSQIFPVTDALDDRAAVLIEPLSIGVHAVLNTPLPEGSQVLVIGSGPIALATLWALRSSGYTGVVVSQVMRKLERDLALKLGATEVMSPGPEARQALVDTGAMAYQPLVGPEVYAGGGFDLVFDCVGSQGSLDQALRFTSPRGQVVMLGCVAQMSRLDLTFVWARELGIKGFVGYGQEEWRGERMHTFEVTQRLLEEVGQGVSEMVTHVFPLSQHRDALKAAAVLPGKESIKVVLRP